MCIRHHKGTSTFSQVPVLMSIILQSSFFVWPSKATLKIGPNYVLCDLLITNESIIVPHFTDPRKCDWCKRLINVLIQQVNHKLKQFRPSYVTFKHVYRYPEYRLAQHVSDIPIDLKTCRRTRDKIG